MTSILDDVKEMLGLLPADTSFDNTIIMHINSVFSILHNATGIGGPTAFEITGHQETWDMLYEDIRLNSIKSYVFVRVKVLFDPHIIGAVLAAHERQFLEMETRLQSEADY
jgi:hypothetical protein